MTFNDVEFKACPRCGVEPKMEDVRERSLTKPNVVSVKCPACGMSNSIAWGSMDLPPFRQAAVDARGQLEQPVISSAVELFRATAWRAVPDLVTGPARRALAHGRADAPRVTASQIGETERRARALERDRARALKRSRRARQ